MGKRGVNTNACKHPLYSTWNSMRGRCLCTTHHKYYMYGARGIKICKTWNSFKQFTKDMGPKPSPSHTIDRIDTNGNYEPLNCRWATRVEQQNNTRRNIYVEIDGVTKTLTEWCMLYRISIMTVKSRVVKNGMSWKNALIIKPNTRARTESTVGVRGIECRGRTWGYRIKIAGTVCRKAGFESIQAAATALNKLRAKNGMDLVEV